MLRKANKNTESTVKRKQNPFPQTAEQATQHTKWNPASKYPVG